MANMLIPRGIVFLLLTISRFHQADKSYTASVVLDGAELSYFGQEGMQEVVVGESKVKHALAKVLTICHHHHLLPPLVVVIAIALHCICWG